MAWVAAVVWVRFLVWELLHAVGLAKKKKKEIAVLYDVTEKSAGHAQRERNLDRNSMS